MSLTRTSLLLQRLAGDRQDWSRGQRRDRPWPAGR